MHPLLRTWPVVLLSLVASLLLRPTVVRGQLTCEGEHENFASACVIGTPDAFGVTIRDTLAVVGQVRAYKFRAGPDVTAAHLYLGDLWYDMDVELYRDPPDETEIGRWFIARSAERGERVVQFERPEVIVMELAPANYTLFVHSGDGRNFDPSRGFTVRVALGPPLCSDPVQDQAGLYQLALSIQPRQPTATSLLSFNAAVSPPYTDLFDFDWQVDGQAPPGEPRETVQLAAPDLAATPSGQHRVRVTARGVREYPDPDPAFRQLPPTLAVECSFSVS
jgi:hypothetical protein